MHLMGPSILPPKDYVQTIVCITWNTGIGEYRETDEYRETGEYRETDRSRDTHIYKEEKSAEIRPGIISSDTPREQTEQRTSDRLGTLS